jgi:hypothetical protein
MYEISVEGLTSIFLGTSEDPRRESAIKIPALPTWVSDLLLSLLILPPTAEVQQEGLGIFLTPLRSLVKPGFDTVLGSWHLNSMHVQKAYVELGSRPPQLCSLGKVICRLLGLTRKVEDTQVVVGTS